MLETKTEGERQGLARVERMAYDYVAYHGGAWYEHKDHEELIRRTIPVPVLAELSGMDTKRVETLIRGLSSALTIDGDEVRIVGSTMTCGDRW